MAGGWEWVVDNGAVRIGVTTSRRELTTSTVIVAKRAALLVDPAWDPNELAWIAQDLAAAGIGITAGFATHAHHDHLLWHPGLGGAPRWASGAVVRDAAANSAALVDRLGTGWPPDLADLVGRLTAVEGNQLPWSGAEVEMITHDAHAPGHTALWIPAAKTLLAGDMLSDVELPLLEESSPADFAAGLAALRPLVDRALFVIPGHGRPANGAAAAAARWRADRRYLSALIAVGESDDPRLALPGMRKAHEHNRSRTEW